MTEIQNTSNLTDICNNFVQLLTKPDEEFKLALPELAVEYYKIAGIKPVEGFNNSESYAIQMCIHKATWWNQEPDLVRLKELLKEHLNIC